VIELFLRFRNTVLLLVGALTALAIAGLARPHEISVSRITLPSSDPAMRTNELLGDRFGGLETEAFVIEAPDILSRDALDTIEAVTSEARKLPIVHSPHDVLSLSTLIEPNAPGAERGFHKLLDPRPSIAAERDALWERLRSNPYANGVLVSEDRKAALVLAPVGTRSFPDYELSEPETLERPYQMTEDIISRHSRGDIRVSAAGTPLVNQFGHARTGTELVRISIICLALLTLVFVANSRSWLGTLVPLGMTLISIVWTFGFASWLGAPLNLFSGYVSAVVMAVGSSYAIHAMAYIRLEGLQKQSHRMSIYVGWFGFSIALAVVAIAGICGSLSLLTFDFPDIRMLGLLQAIGITISFLLAFFLVPPVMFYFTRPTELSLGPVGRSGPTAAPTPRKPPGLVDRLLPSLCWLPIRSPWASVALLVALIGVSCVGARRITAEWAPEEWMPASSLPAQGASRIAAHFPKTKAVLLVLENGAGGNFFKLEKLERLRDVERLVLEEPGVRELPSLAKVFSQAELAFTGEERLPRTQAEYDQLLVAVGKRNLGKLVDAQGRLALLTLLLPDAGPASLDASLASIRSRLERQSRLPFAGFAGWPLVFRSINDYVVTNKVESILLCLVIVFVLCSMINASMKLGLIAMSPAALAGLMTFAFMGFAGIRLDISTATTTTIAIGVGVDFAIHFLVRYRSDLAIHASRNAILDVRPPREVYKRVAEQTVRDYGRVIVFDILSNLLGFSALMFSSFRGFRMAGLLLAFNQTAVILATFFLTPLLLILFRPVLIYKRKKVSALSRAPVISTAQIHQ
jgi:predicted RND superfamily exporter protein